MCQRYTTTIIKYLKSKNKKDICPNLIIKYNQQSGQISLICPSAPPTATID